MTFDIHQKIFDADGSPHECVAKKYQDELVDLFEQSPEGQALREEGIHGRWTGIMLDLGQSYLGITPPKMSAKDMREILFDLIPLKISAIAEQAPEIIRELQAFWSFLQREFHLVNAATCLAVFNDKATQQLKEEMSNPANFGIAKSMVMMGLERGFDMQTEEGINEWMMTYNAELMAGTGKPINLAGWAKQMGFGYSALLGASDEDDEDDDIIEESDEDLLDLVSHSHSEVASRSSRKASTKQRAKMAKASRKKNRKKK